MAATVVVALLAALVGYAGYEYVSLSSGIKRSDARASGPGSLHGDTNILVMGLDSRLDENGKPLPKALYAALHSGDQQNGGLNSNVLMLLHIPGNGGSATAIAIPRDDYAALAGCPDGECMGKIKQAYGLAFDQASRRLAQQGLSGTTLQQRARDAGRKAEMDTVRQFLGGVPIDHFVEVTMVAFFQISQVVQPITVCVKEDTQDAYSGANFHAGRQQINASQALGFVRQRRDTVHPDLNFTDLDRSRRQQAFIASLFYQLKQADTFTDPGKLDAILNVAKRNTAVDGGLDVLSLARVASNLSGGQIHFFTLPVARFGHDPRGEAVNIVDLPLIQSTVHQLLYGGSGATAASRPTTTPTGTTAPAQLLVDVVNASGRPGAARTVATALGAKGYRTGPSGTNPTILETSLVDYAPGEQDAAAALAALLGGLPTRVRSGVAPGSLRVVIGTGFSMPTALGGTPTATQAPAKAVAATGGGRSGPPVTALTDLSGGGIPCVK
ncbi:LCP family protein [Pedococcus sp. NPDC057267]|uniref:LCP family protein n=1 Tax=Pedococcus sp. NPDC057267 TaxID=3346077 RepID=UPI00363EC586